MTTAKLPTPPQWQSGTPNFLLTLLFTLIATVVLTLLAVSYASDVEQWAVATAAATSAAGFLLIAVAGTLEKLRIARAGGRVGPTGTVLTPRSVRGWLIAGAALIAFGSGLYIANLIRLGADFRTLVRYLEIIVIFAMSVISVVVMVYKVGRNVGRLTLSPYEVTLVNGRGRAQTVPWERVTNVLDAWIGEKPTSQPISITAPGCGVLVIKYAENYCDDAAALFWLLRYYWLTPASRIELATGDALNRLAHNHIAPM